MKQVSRPSVTAFDSEQTVKGIIALVIATLFFAAQDAITKHLIQTISVAQIVNVRFFFFSLFALAYAARNTSIKTAIVSASPVMQVFRGLLICSEIALFAYALNYMGLAEMHAIFACFPLIITALSAPFLGESVGWRRWIAILLGFIGTLIIIQPGSGVFSPYALMALACALMFAIYNLLTRKVSRQDSFETSLLYFGLVGFVGSLVAIPFYWQIPNADETFWLLIISMTAIIGHLLLIKALQLAPAVILQPFNYFVLIWAIIIGYTVYGELLELQTLVGAAVVVASGIYIAHREYLVARRARNGSPVALNPPKS